MSKYKEHLQSDYWKQVRKHVLRRESGKCQSCWEHGNQVHHNTYKHLYNELEHLETLTLLCDYCHRVAHGLEPKMVSMAELERIAMEFYRSKI